MSSHRRDVSSSSDPLGYLITWTAYGTWLPGDERGWVLYKRGWQQPDPMREMEARMWCQEDACYLDPEQRAVVEKCVRDHCQIRQWILYAVNCRTNHCHAVISAPVDPKVIRAQIKAWATRRLKQLAQNRQARFTQARVIRQRWWADRGSCRWLFDATSLEAAIRYVRDAQDRPRA